MSTTLTAADLASKWTGKKGLDPVVIWDLELDTRDDGSARLTYSWKSTNNTGIVGVSCCDPSFFLKTYTKMAQPPIDYALVYVGLAAIGRKAAWGVANYFDAKVLIDIGAGDLLRPAPGTSHDAAKAALLTFLASL